MGRIISLNEAAKISKDLKSRNHKIILTGGCFDILHPGHVQFLRRSKQLGGTLMIILESDASVKNLKGEGRPVYTQRDRAKILASLVMVDYVVPVRRLRTDRDYYHLVEKIKPDIITITRNDPQIKNKRKQAKLVGGKLIEVINRKETYSTSKIVESLTN